MALAARSDPRRGRRVAGFDYVLHRHAARAADYERTVVAAGRDGRQPAVPIVRVPWNEPGIIGRVLDAGALGVIIPMVNSPEEARRAVDACRYAPTGARSFGPLIAGGALRRRILGGGERPGCVHPDDRDPPGGRAHRRHPRGAGHRRGLHRPRRPVDHLRAAARARQPGRAVRRARSPRWSRRASDTASCRASTQQRRSRPSATAAGSA